MCSKNDNIHENATALAVISTKYPQQTQQQRVLRNTKTSQVNQNQTSNTKTPSNSLSTPTTCNRTCENAKQQHKVHTTASSVSSVPSAPSASPIDISDLTRHQWIRNDYQLLQSSEHLKNFNVPITRLPKLIIGAVNCPRSSFNHIITLLIVCIVVWHNCIGGARAAPHSCVLCDKEDLKAKELNSGNNYEEYLFEHQVTRSEAVRQLRTLNESFFDGPSSCAVSCTNTVMNYCLGPQFINDHCWCELGHTIEGLPFVPHICYVGEKLYTASVGSCFFYEEVKECCCAPALATQWRHISGAPHGVSLPPMLFIVLAALMVHFVSGRSPI